MYSDSPEALPQSNPIAILGCGWLGLPLGHILISRGYPVNGSTTSPGKLTMLEQIGIAPYQFSVEPQLPLDPSHVRDFFQVDTLIVNIPPGRGREQLVERHTTQMERVIQNAEQSGVQRTIFISSTSVYPSNGGRMTESDAVPGQAIRASGEALLRVERLWAGSTIDTTVLRMGGLYGPGRHPARYLAGRKNLGKANAPVNLIHLDDCIGLIERCLELRTGDLILNGCSDKHPTRAELYPKACELLNLDPPAFAPDDTPANQYKTISNEAAKQRLDYDFVYPDPADENAILSTLENHISEEYEL
ncbi:MAG: SDR family oxidoreductase [Bacteroidota bacterium]